jgi:hypothetical protein
LARGIEIGHGGAGEILIHSSAAEHPAINIQATTSATSEPAILLGYHAYTWPYTQWKMQLEATGAGGINILGTTPNNSSRASIEMTGTNVLSREGAILIDGNTRGVNFSQWYWGLGHNIIGSCLTADINASSAYGNMCDKTVVTTSSAPITVRGDRIGVYADNRILTFRTTGDLVVEPKSANFSHST